MIDLCLFLSFFRPDAKTNGFSGCFWCQRIQTVLYQLFSCFVKALHEKSQIRSSTPNHAPIERNIPNISPILRNGPSAIFCSLPFRSNIRHRQYPPASAIPNARLSQTADNPKKKPPAAISLTSPPPTAPGLHTAAAKAAIRQ